MSDVCREMEVLRRNQKVVKIKNTATAENVFDGLISMLHIAKEEISEGHLGG